MVQAERDRALDDHLLRFSVAQGDDRALAGHESVAVDRHHHGEATFAPGLDP
jgi:hypothetical protein